MTEEESHRKTLLKNSCWVAFLHPLTFIVPDDEKPWEVKLEDINNITYNSGNLIRIVSRLKSTDLELDGMICYDGAIAVPRKGKLDNKEEAVNFFNKLFAQLILSGYKAEGVDLRDIVKGNLYDNYAITTYDFGNSAVSQMHTKIRTLMVSNIDTIQLSNPRIMNVSKFIKMIEDGERILKKIPNLSPKFLAKGITEIRYKNWDLVLSNLWITSEQIIDFLWHNVFLTTDKFQPESGISGRIPSLKDDSRTWSAVVKQEILYQNRIITEDVFSNLYNARKVRNKLVHEGKPVERNIALGLYDAVKKLLNIATGEKYILKQFPIDDKFYFDKNLNLDDEMFEEWKKLPEDNFTEGRFGTEILKKVKFKK